MELPLPSTARFALLLGFGLVLGACSDDDDDPLPFGELYSGYDQTDVSSPVLLPLTLTPQTVDPGVTSFTVFPALPAGLSIDAATGVVSGTATALAADATYTVRAFDGAIYDDESFTLEVRAPLVGLSSDMPLARTTSAAGSATAPTAGGVGLTGAAPVTSDLTVTSVDAPNTATEALVTSTATPSNSVDPIPDSFDSLVDFVATIALDGAELSADAWTFAAQAPYDAVGLTPQLPNFTLDTSTAPLVDGELRLDVELAGMGLGPFDSAALSTRSHSIEPITSAFSEMDSSWTAMGGTFYFTGRAAGSTDRELYRFTPGTTAVFEQAVDRNLGANDGARILTAIEDRLYLGLEDGAGFSKLHVYDATADQLDQISDINPSGNDDFGDQIFELDNAVYFVATDANGSHVYRYTPGNGVAAASTERISFVTTTSAEDEAIGAMVVWNAMLYFVATDSAFEQNLYQFDPATSVQSRVNGSAQQPITQLRSAGDALFAVALNASGATKLFQLDSTAGNLVQVANTSGDLAVSDDPLLLDELPTGLLFVSKNAGGVLKLFLFEPDATTPQLVQLTDINGALADDVIVELEATSTHLYTAAFDSNGNTKLFAYEFATGVTRQVADVNGPGTNDSPCDMLALSDERLALACNSTATGGFSIFVYDPVLDALLLVGDPNGAGNDDNGFVLGEDASGRLLISAQDGAAEITAYTID